MQSRYLSLLLRIVARIIRAVKKTRRVSDQERKLLEAIGALMLGARRGHGSQRDIAEKVDVSQSRISRWESGRAIPNALELIRFAEACNTRPERLIEGVAMPTVEQLHMELDPKAGAIVGELVQILHERRAPSAAEPVLDDPGQDAGRVAPVEDGPAGLADVCE